MATSNTSTVAPLDYAGADTYTERRPGLRREYVLSGDCLVIRSKKLLGTRSEIPIALRHVNPVYAKIWTRNQGSAKQLVTGLGFFFFLGFLLKYDIHPPSRITIGLFCGLGLIFIVQGLMHLRAIEHASFGHSGGPRFDVARSGPDRDRFDAFVGRIVGRVNELRSQGDKRVAADHSSRTTGMNEPPQVPPASSAPPAA
jgi:hypothetical protein